MCINHYKDVAYGILFLVYDLNVLTLKGQKGKCCPFKQMSSWLTGKTVSCVMRILKFSVSTRQVFYSLRWSKFLCRLQKLSEIYFCLKYPHLRGSIPY